MVGILIFGIGIGVLVVIGFELIKVYLNSKIFLKMKGVIVIVKDVNGKMVLLIIYNGIMYLLVWVVGILFGIEIIYDSVILFVLIGGENEIGLVIKDKVILSIFGIIVLGFIVWYIKDFVEIIYKGKDYKDVYLYIDFVK